MSDDRGERRVNAFREARDAIKALLIQRGIPPPAGGDLILEALASVSSEDLEDGRKILHAVEKAVSKYRR